MVTFRVSIYKIQLVSVCLYARYGRPNYLSNCNEAFQLCYNQYDTIIGVCNEKWQNRNKLYFPIWFLIIRLKFVYWYNSLHCNIEICSHIAHSRSRKSSIFSTKKYWERYIFQLQQRTENVEEKPIQCSYILCQLNIGI